jgi:hypothetical protein
LELLRENSTEQLGEVQVGQIFEKTVESESAKDELQKGHVIGMGLTGLI